MQSLVWRLPRVGLNAKGGKVGNRIRSSWRVALLVAGLLLLLTTIPAVGSHLPNDEGTLRLHVGSDATYFEYAPADGAAVQQTIDAPERCELAVNGPLAALSGSDRGPGLNGISIGIKSGGAQGVPCGRVDGSEDLTLSLAGVPLASMADLDLELKGDAKVRLDVRMDGSVVESFEVRSGASIVEGQGVDGAGTEPFTATATTDDPATERDESIANCRNQSDSGPDAGARDNCRVTIDPSLPFDAVSFVPLVGEMSLEGSGDFGDDTDFDTVFYLTSFQGVLGCDAENNSVEDEDGDVVGTIVRYENRDGSDCVLKPYSIVAQTSDPAEEGAQSVTFEVADPGAQEAIYEFFITFDQELTTPLSAVLQYDPDGSDDYDDFVDMLACVEDYSDLSDDPEGSLNDEAIPSGHQGCIADVSQNWDGTTTWHGIFFGDWKFR